MGEDFVHGVAGEPALEIAFEGAGYFLAGGVGGCHVGLVRSE